MHLDDYWRPFFRNASRLSICVILCLAVSVEHRLVTDADTDRHRHRAIAYTAHAQHHAVKIESTAHYAPQPARGAQREKYIHRHTTYVNYEQTDVP